ncbi:MAG: hypothetical protein ACXAD7_16650 [Candidatus Kariarchaeaceae archaeon]|jgi:hypothetical protein
MSETYGDILSTSRLIAAKLYYNWLDKINFLEPFSRPESIPSVIYEKRWVAKNDFMVERIFNFLATFNVFSEAGGMWTMHERSSQALSAFDRIVLSEYKNHPTYRFINYGLRLLEAKLEGDTGIWDIVQHNFIFERGLTQPSYQLLCRFIEDIVGQEIKNTSHGHNVTLLGIYPECFISALDEFFNISKFTILTPNDKFKHQIITYCELDVKTAKFSNRVFVEKEYISRSLDKADIIFVANGMGFYRSLNDYISYLKQFSKEGTSIFMVAPTDPKVQIGIEPIFCVHPDFNELPSDLDLQRRFRAMGFTEPKRTGPFNLVFKTVRN